MNEQMPDIEIPANPEPQKEEPKAPPQVGPVEVVSGALVPKDSSELNRTLANIAQGGGFPDRFDTPQKRIAAYNLAQSLMGGKWQLALNNMANIKGQLSIYGELPGALAEQTGEVVEKEVYRINRDGLKISTENKNLDDEVYAGVCVIQRKGRGRKEFTYTIEEAKHAGQYPAKKRDGQINNDSPWMKWTGLMLMRKAMALAVKFEFPDAVMGVPIAEHDFHEAPDLMKDVTESRPSSENFGKSIDDLQ